MDKEKFSKLLLKSVIKSYPNDIVTCLDENKSEITMEEFVKDIDSGDGLFDFIVKELTIAEDFNDAIKLLLDAQKDLTAVLVELAHVNLTYQND